MGVVTSTHVKSGEELFTYYGYPRLNMPYDYPWYWELKRKVQEEDE